MRINKGIIQAGLLILIASAIAGAFLVKNVDFSSVSAKINQYKKWYIDKPQEKTGKQGYLYKGVVKEKPDNADPKKTAYEGCLTDYRDSGGLLEVRQKSVLLHG